MDAWLFAEIMYATEDMLSDYGMEEAVNATHIPATIARCKARRRSHFREVAAIFTRHVGADRVSPRDTPE